MQKKDIIQLVATRMRQIGQPIKINHIKVIVECVLEVFIDQLKKSGRIEIRNFGVFNLKKTPSRIGRNPITGEEAEIKARYFVQFKAGRTMKKSVAQKKTLK